MFVGELKQDIKTLTGVGKKTREDYENLDIRTLSDLIQTTPRGYEDRSHRICIGRQNDEDGSWTNTFVRAESVSEFGPGRKNVKIIVRDTENNQKAFLMGFNRTYLSKTVFPGKGYPLQHSSLENSMDCIVHGVAKSRTRLSDFHFHFTL